MDVLGPRIDHLASIKRHTPAQIAEFDLLVFFQHVLDVHKELAKHCESPESLTAFMEKCRKSRTPSLFKKMEDAGLHFMAAKESVKKAQEAEKKREERAEKKRQKATVTVPAATAATAIPTITSVAGAAPIAVHIHLPQEVLKTAKKGGARTKKTIPKSVKEKVWHTYVGKKTESPCLVCRSEKISILSFHAGHVVAEANGGETTVENLRPICHRCNLQMGAMNMDEYCMRWYKRHVGDV
jgi:hypothetical protein